MNYGTMGSIIETDLKNYQWFFQLFSDGLVLLLLLLLVVCCCCCCWYLLCVLILFIFFYKKIVSLQWTLMATPRTVQRTRDAFSLARHNRYADLKTIFEGQNHEFHPDTADEKGNSILLVACQNGEFHSVSALLVTE